MKDKISIVIPCYNLDSYLPKCLDSLLSQTYENLEIIAVDDGSPDNTREILKEYEKTDKRIKAVYQENSGAGVAINRGIELASGAFMGFMDNDDYAEPQMYEKLHKALTENDADMAVCNFNLVYDDRTELCYSATNSHDAVVDIHDDVYGYFARYCTCPKPNNYTWSRLYKSEIIKKSDVRFEKFRLGSDTLFNFKLLPRFNRVAFIKCGLYNYVQRSDSIVHQAARGESIAKVYADGFDSLASYYEKNGFTDFLQVLPIHAYTRYRSVFFYSRLAGKNDEEIENEIKENFLGRKIYDYLTGAVRI